MKYRLIEIFKIEGLNRQKEEDVYLYSNIQDGLIAFLTMNLEKHSFEADRQAALMGYFLFGMSLDKLNDKIEDIINERKTKYGVGPFLVIEVNGEIAISQPEVVAEHDQFDVSCSEKDNELIKSDSEDHIHNILSSFAIEINGAYSFKRVAGASFFIRENGKLIYAYKITFNPVRIGSLQSLKEENIDKVKILYQKMNSDNSLERVLHLFMLSLMADQDPLQKFQYSWNALEIFINKSFEDYEKELFNELNAGSHPKTRREYLDRIRTVMKDKYRLKDKFSLISSRLCPNDSDADTTIFNDIKKLRDKILHGADICEVILPVDSCQNLLRKYLSLHLIK
jgi:hypothetical protein